MFKLQNGEYFLYENGRLSIHKYFDAVDAFHVDEGPVLTEWEDKIASAFTESVEMHKISDVEVGCFLSSGVDSSYVVREVSKVTKDVKTFSVGYEEERYSELPYAQDFSRVIGVENISNKVSADEFFGMAGKIQYYMDEPLPNPSEIPLFFPSAKRREIRQGRALRRGRGRALRRVPDVSRGRAFRPLRPYPRTLRRAAATLAKRLPDFKGKRFVIRGALEPYQRFMRANYVFTRDERNRYLKKPITAKDPVAFAKPHFDRAAHLDEPTRLQYVDMQTWMLYDILQKADRMSMANSWSCGCLSWTGRCWSSPLHFPPATGWMGT